MMSWIILYLLVGTPSLLRIDYVVEWKEESRSVSAKLTLNQVSEDRFVLVCRKTTAGVFFKIWVTPDRIVFYFPSELLAFEGPADVPFRLFPGGPRLTGDRWLDLLLKPQSSAETEGFCLAFDGTWSRLSLIDQGFEVRWRERKRTLKNVYSDRLFEPRVRDDATHLQLAELDAWWEPR